MHRAIAVSLATLVACSSAALADDETPPVVGGKTYVQHQILAAKNRYAEIAEITVTGKSPDGKASVILGSTASARNVFKAAPEPSDGSIVAGRYFVVREPFLSSSCPPTRYDRNHASSSTRQPARLRRSLRKFKQRMARRTLSAKNAADPYPFDPKFGPATFAQQAHRTNGRERTLTCSVMMIHATPPKGAHNVIIGSNIGRFGKQADEDDLRVIEKGSTNLEVGGDNDRYETELPLLDRSGKRIGALGLVFGLKPDTDKEALHKHGLAIRDEVARAIPNNAALFKTDALISGAVANCSENLMTARNFLILACSLTALAGCSGKTAGNSGSDDRSATQICWVDRPARLHWRLRPLRDRRQGRSNVPRGRRER